MLPVKWLPVAGTALAFSFGLLVGRASGFPGLAACSQAPSPAPEAVQAAGAAAPAWVLPVQRARGEAREQGRPLLVVSLNGNLDGYC